VGSEGNMHWPQAEDECERQERIGTLPLRNSKYEN